VAEERVDRRLAAIVCADVVEYSRLMGADEEGTHDALKTHRRELIDPLIAQHQGRIFKTTGDGMLIEFASVVDAVRCAVVVQQGMQSRDANLPADRRIRFRIGINLGDVIVDEGDIFGDGVNVAARLQTLAEPGEICVSAAVREQIGDKLPIGFADRGEHSVKNIARPIHVYRVEKRGEVLAAGADESKPRLALPDRPSIAVLAFANMSGDADQEYFADGVVEDIITGLSRIKELFVIARNSSFTYKGRAVDVKQVGRELGVRYVLEGSVRKSGNRVRITVQLIETETGAHVWAERYERTYDDIFALQDEITLSVIAAIEPSLRQAEVERAKRKRPDNLDAYDLTLRALPLVYTAMPDPARQALVIIEQALRLEPDYARAHGLAAFCHENLFVRAGLHEENRMGAIRHAHAAIASGRDDATALALAGVAIGMVEHDALAAYEAFTAALAVSPSSSLSYLFGSLILGWAAEAERAVEWGERALRLSPFDPWAFCANHGILLGYFHLRRDEESARAARKSIQINPGFSISHMMLAAPLARLGRIAEAKAAAARCLALQPSFTISKQLAGVGAVPAIAEPMTEALLQAGLPE
jgi:adenylate cyclase